MTKIVGLSLVPGRNFGIRNSTAWAQKRLKSAQGFPQEREQLKPYKVNLGAHHSSSGSDLAPSNVATETRHPQVLHLHILHVPWAGWLPQVMAIPRSMHNTTVGPGVSLVYPRYWS